MTEFEELLNLSLLGLASRLNERSADKPALRGEWRSVLELFTSRVAAEDRAVLAANWRQLVEAYDLGVDSAIDCGDIDAREGALRQINLLVRLASIVETTGDKYRLFSWASGIALQRTPLTLDDAQRKAVNWQTLPLDEMRSLRFAKNLFSPLQLLGDEASDLPAMRAVAPWLKLLPSLP